MDTTGSPSGARSRAPTVTLFMPVLNEIDGLRAILPAIRPEWFSQILLVDGGSHDGSVEFARAHGVETYVQKKRGIRFAYIEAWPLIRCDLVITFSPDGNCPPEAVPLLSKALADGEDMVIASRYLGPAKSDDDDTLTAFGNWMFTRLINLCHGGRYTDAMGIYRDTGRRSSINSIWTRTTATPPRSCAERRSALSPCSRFDARRGVCACLRFR